MSGHNPTKTETDRHVIYRKTEHSLLDDVLGRWGPEKTQIYDKRTGTWAEGTGNTREEADRAAWDDLESKKHS